MKILVQTTCGIKIMTHVWSSDNEEGQRMYQPKCRDKNNKGWIY